MILIPVFFGMLSCATLPKLLGSGKTRTDERLIGKFDSIKISGNIKIDLVPGEQTQVKVTGDDNILYAVKTELDGSTLVIKTQCDCVLAPSLPVSLEIPANNVVNVMAEGDSKIFARGLTSKKLTVNLESKSELTLYDQKTEKLTLKLSDSTKAVLSGEVKNLKIDLEDQAQVDAQQLVATNAKIDFSDKTNGTLQVVEDLKAEIEDQAQLILVKEPKSTKTEVKDRASIVRKY